jgi:arsenical pump membrane protein
MIMTGVVQEVGVFDRIALRIEAYGRRRSAAHAFTMVFVVSVITAALLNNDAAILLLTPLVIASTRRLYPGRPEMTVAFAFAVFLAPGVAPFVISNPMNMIVAEFAGIGFLSYARVMLPISLAGAALTFLILRMHFRELLARKAARFVPPRQVPPPHRAETPAVALLLGVFASYPVMAAFGGPVWVVSLGGAVGSLLVALHYRVAPAQTLMRHVSPDILVFLWGVFLVVVGLRHVGVVDGLASVYQGVPKGGLVELGVVGIVAALGSALVDNHPMSLLNMMALGAQDGSRPLLAALIGGDIGPRLLPIGSLAGLLWMDVLRRSGVELGAGRFARLGTLVLLPTLSLSLVMLWLLTTP